MKIHLDRIRKKYGWTEGKYQDLISVIIGQNNINIANNIAGMKSDFWKKQTEKIKPKERIITPSMQEVIPQRAVYIRKAAINGRLITDTLRDSLTKKLRQKLTEFTPKTKEYTYFTRRGETAGKINPKLIKEFESDIRKTFENYVKKDKRYKMPSNVHSIAVTEFRGTVSDIRKNYTDTLLRKNPGMEITKTWIHNKSLSERYRKGHYELNGKTILYNDKFKVRYYKTLKNKYVYIRTDLMDAPYDISAKPEQVIGCSCDLIYRTKVKPEKKTVRKSLLISIEKSLNEYYNKINGNGS